MIISRRSFSRAANSATLRTNLIGATATIDAKTIIRFKRLSETTSDDPTFRIF